MCTRGWVVASGDGRAVGSERWHQLQKRAVATESDVTEGEIRLWMVLSLSYCEGRCH